MKHGSLFSGIGGFDLAADWMGWENVFHCEIAEFPRKILNHYWPNADCHEDIKKTDFTKYRGTVDIISGGFPCQPYSAAGKRLGKEDDRHLWPEMLRVIREVKPQWVVGENVRGLLNWNGGMVFHEVCADLENIGYEVQSFIIPASGVNAPHQRERLWIIAHSTSNGHDDKSKEKYNGIWSDNKQSRTQWERAIKGFSDERFTSDSDNGSRSCDTVQTRREEFKELYDLQSIATESDLHGFDERNGNDEINASKRGINALNDIDQISINTKRIGRIKKWNDNGQFKETQQEKCRELKFSRTDSTQDRWRNFPTQSPVCSGDDGISYGLDNITFSKWRNESIKGYGNAVVPQIVYRIFKTIEYIQNLKP